MATFRLGIDAGGTKVAYGLFDENNTLIDRAQHPTPIEADGPAFSDLLIKGIHEILERNSLSKRDQYPGTAKGRWLRPRQHG